MKITGDYVNKDASVVRGVSKVKGTFDIYRVDALTERSGRSLKGEYTIKGHANAREYVTRLEEHGIYRVA